MPFALVIQGQPVSLVAVVVTGIAVGFVAGMFGVGGGFLLTPLLSAVLGVPLPIAIGSGLCQMIGTAMTTYLRHRSLRQGEVWIDILMLPGSLLGVRAGSDTLAWLTASGSVRLHGHDIPRVTLTVDSVYVVLLLVVARVFWVRSKPSDDRSGVNADARLARLQWGGRVRLPNSGLQVSAILVAQIGLCLGFLSGLLGIGGGVALMPLLVYGFGLPIHQAAGTGIVLLLATACAGTVAHGLRGNVDLTLSVLLLVGSTLAAQLGALMTRRLAAADLRRGFSFVILAAACAVVWDVVRRLV